MFLDTDSPSFRDTVLAYAFALTNSGRRGDQKLKPLDVFRTNGEGLPQQELIFTRNKIVTLPTEGALGKIEQQGWFAAGAFARWASDTTARLTA